MTRDDPRLPLARLRARGQATELRAADLRFTPSEIDKLLLQMLGKSFSSDEIALLDSHTEGWVTGLQLVAVSMQGHEKVSEIIQNFSGGHRFVLDYLVEEVLDQQPKEIQDFLLHTAILNRLTGSLCNALTGQNNGQQILEALEHANLFIVPLDHERRWYRYHHLFADLLRLRLQQACLDVESTLHRQASEWYEKNGFTDEAIEHALRIEDFDRATQLLFEHFDSLLNQGKYTKVRRWLIEIPDKFVFTKPDLCILNAWYLFVRGDLEEAERSLEAAEKNFLAGINSADTKLSSESDQLVVSKLRGRVAAIRAFIYSYRGNISGMMQSAHQALEDLPPQDLTWRSTVAIALGDAYGMAGDMASAYKARLEALEASKAGENIYLILICSMKLAVTVRMRGQLQRAIDICQQELLLANEKGVSQMAVEGCLLAIWAEVLAEINELDEALSKARRGIEITARGEDIALNGWSQMCLVRVLFIRGDLEGAENIIRKLEGISQKYQMPPFVSGQISAWRARILLARKQLGAASQWAEARNLNIEGNFTQLNEGEYIVLARVLLAQGQMDEVVSLLQRLFENAKAGDRIAKMIEILILQTLALHASGDPEQAMAFLEQALTLAEPGGFVRIFVDEGSVLAGLLYEAAKHKIAPHYTQRLLSAFPGSELDQTAAGESKISESDELIQPLSERELDVLRLVAKGLQRQEIASNLVLSLNTVKTHMRNIFRKLGVKNQMQAVAKARAFGIVESD